MVKYICEIIFNMVMRWFRVILPKIHVDKVSWSTMIMVSFSRYQVTFMIFNKYSTLAKLWLNRTLRGVLTRGDTLLTKICLVNFVIIAESVKNAENTNFYSYIQNGTHKRSWSKSSSLEFKVTFWKFQTVNHATSGWLLKYFFEWHTFIFIHL